MYFPPPFFYLRFPPTLALAAKPTENVVSNTLTVSYSPVALHDAHDNNLKTPDRVEPNGIKKQLLVAALKYGGKLLEEFLEYLGKAEYSAFVKKHRIAIADYLDGLTTVAENKLVDFLIFTLEIPQGAARVIASCIMFL